MKIKKRIKQLEARCDLLERTIVDHIFLDDHMLLDDHADEEFPTIFSKDHPDFNGEARGGNPAPTVYNTKNIDRIETVENIDIITNKPVDDKPEIIGDYMSYRGEDYYRIYTERENISDTCGRCSLKNKEGCKLPCENWYWKNIKEIDITDDIAKLRPLVTWDNKEGIWTLFGVNGVNAVIGKILEGVVYSNYTPNIENMAIATVTDLKKAGITE